MIHLARWKSHLVANCFCCHRFCHLKALPAVTSGIEIPTLLCVLAACSSQGIVFVDTVSCRFMFIATVICYAFVLCFLATFHLTTLLSISQLQLLTTFMHDRCFPLFSIVYHYHQHSSHDTYKDGHFCYSGSGKTGANIYASQNMWGQP